MNLDNGLKYESNLNNLSEDLSEIESLGTTIEDSDSDSDSDYNYNLNHNMNDSYKYSDDENTVSKNSIPSEIDIQTKMKSFSKIIKKFEINQYTKINSIIPTLLSQKHSYEDFILLMRLCVNKMNKQNTSCFYFNVLKDPLVGFINRYYIDNNFDNIVKIVEFIKLFKEGMNFESENYFFETIIIDTLLDKLTPYDVEYLINHNIIDYYCGKRKIPQMIFDVFYNYRHQLIHSNTNAFVMRGYNWEQLEDLINISLKAHVSPHYIWIYVSERVLTLKTPFWFWEKYKTKIIWEYTIENIIYLLDENDSLQLEIFIKLMKDFYVFIDDKLHQLPKSLCLPEALIAIFCNSIKLDLLHLLKFQKFSIKLLNFLAEHDIFNQKHWDCISRFQILNPEFMKKYESNLDWKLLNYNPTWKHYPYNQYHRLLEMNNTNVLLWGTIDDKIKHFQQLGLDLNKVAYFNNNTKNVRNTKNKTHLVAKTLDKNNSIVQLYVHYLEPKFALDKNKNIYTFHYSHNPTIYDLTYHDTCIFSNRYSMSSDFKFTRNLVSIKYISSINANKLVTSYSDNCYHYNCNNLHNINFNDDSYGGIPAFACIIDINKSLNEGDSDCENSISGTKLKKITININDILINKQPVRLKNSHNSRKKLENYPQYIPILLPFNYYYQIM